MATMTTDSAARALQPAVTAPGTGFEVRRRRGTPGDFPAGRVMVAEVAAIAVAVAALAPAVTARVVSGVIALVLIVAVSARSGGRWWLANLPRRTALRARRRTARAAAASAAASGDVRLVSLAAAAPGALIREFTDRDTAIGVGQDDRGWYCALVVAPWTTLHGERHARLRLDRLARVFAETSVPVSTMQVLNYVVPGPTGALDAASPLHHSYRELLGAEPVRSEQAVWVAVRLDPRDAAAASVSRGGGLDGVDRALATTIARVGKALSENDIPYRVLDADALLGAVSGAIGGHGAVLDERWQLCYGGGVAQACFEIVDWPRDRPGDVLDAFTRVPAALVSVAVVLSPSEGGVGLRGLVRVGAHPNQIGWVSRDLVEVARRAGGRLRRLDGEHGPAVYATCPTGGAA